MQFKRAKRRLQKQLASRQGQAQDLSQSAEKTFDRHLLKRLDNLKAVRRFVLGWIGLWLLLGGCLIWQMVMLSGYFQVTRPVAGGIYDEGQVGLISNVNPIYAASDVDTSLSNLVFAGLLTHSANNQLIGELASDYNVAADNLTYTVSLKPGLTWQDGKPLTAEDVVFTYQSIQNPDAQSPLQAAWQGIKIAAISDRVVRFKLPVPLATFPANLTTGILPKHLLGNVKPADLRSSDFNSQPVGAGPFKWSGLQVTGNDPASREEQVALVPFDHYAGGRPQLAEFVLHAYAEPDSLIRAFRSGQLTAAAGLDRVPGGLPAGTQTHSLLLTAGTYTFFKTTTGVLADTKVRQALVAGSRPADIINRLGYLSRPVVEPLLNTQLGFNLAYAQKTGDQSAAKSLLQQAGWQPGGDGMMTKNGQPLTFTLTAVDTPEYHLAATQLRNQWLQIGVNTKLQFESAQDYKTTLANHDYQATIYGISLGNDPDVYVYWDSSQADIRSSNRLNLSEWKNPTADAALEAGRTRLDPQLRVIKYTPFLKAWQQEAPALGLYQPRYIYLTRGSVYGLPSYPINSGTDRLNNIAAWKIRTARVTE